MLTLRCTAKVLRRFGLRPADQPPGSVGCLGDWYANLLNLGAQRHVLCVSEESLLPVILPARNQEFPARFSEYLYRMLLGLEIPEELAAREAAEAAEITIARTANRSVLGVRNDMTASMPYYVVPDDPLMSALRLSQVLYSPLGYERPAMVARSLFGLEERARPGSTS
jgi:hypothetical protein